MPISEHMIDVLDPIVIDGMEENIVRVSGRVTNEFALSAFYRIHIDEYNIEEPWVMELTHAGKFEGTVLMVYMHNNLGFQVVDPLPEEVENFPPYDLRSAMTRKEFFASGLSAATFELVDEICLNDAEIWNHHEQFRYRLFCSDLGTFYVADALQIGPKLEADQVFCEYFLDVDGDWAAVTWEQMQKAAPKNKALIRFPQQHADLACYHHEKLFPKGTLFFQDGDSGDDGWLDETTFEEAIRLENQNALELELAELLRQKSAIEAEMADVEKELLDDGNQWRMQAMQNAQKKNRQNKERIDSNIDMVKKNLSDLESQ